MVAQDINDVHFSMLINITDTDLRDKAQADGDDIVFTDSDGNRLAHQIEGTFNSTTGHLKAWVNVSDISNNSSNINSACMFLALMYCSENSCLFLSNNHLL